MKNHLTDFKAIDRVVAAEILNLAVTSMLVIQIKTPEDKRIIHTSLKLNKSRTRYLLTNASDVLPRETEATIKIMLPLNLYFLKTYIKNAEGGCYFDDISNLFELIRRKSSRYPVPREWTQFAQIQSANSNNSLKTLAHIIELSKTGMRMRLSPEIPRYEKNQFVRVKFKMHRRGEINLNAKIVHLKKNVEGGPTVGIQFLDLTDLNKNKLQNLYDDLAFYHIARPKI